MSRSVIVPIKRSFSQIGSQPASNAFISAAASTREASGLMQRGLGVMMSLISILFHSPLGGCTAGGLLRNGGRLDKNKLGGTGLGLIPGGLVGTRFVLGKLVKRLGGIFVMGGKLVNGGIFVAGKLVSGGTFVGGKVVIGIPGRGGVVAVLFPGAG